VEDDNGLDCGGSGQRRGELGGGRGDRRVRVINRGGHGDGVGGGTGGIGGIAEEKNYGGDRLGFKSLEISLRGIRR